MNIRTVRALGVLVFCGLAGGALAEGTDTSGTKAVSIANPAAEFCIESGGKYVIRDGTNGQVGICTLPDGTEVDAWVYFREHNADGG